MGSGWVWEWGEEASPWELAVGGGGAGHKVKREELLSEPQESVSSLIQGFGLKSFSPL